MTKINDTMIPIGLYYTTSPKNKQQNGERVGTRTPFLSLWYSRFTLNLNAHNYLAILR